MPLSLSTLADQVGAGCAVLEPILKRIEAHVFAAERLHGDDTTVPVLAKGKTDTGSRRPSRRSAMSRTAARARAGRNRTSLYQEITNKIIAELEAGRAPWVRRKLLSPCRRTRRPTDAIPGSTC